MCYKILDFIVVLLALYTICLGQDNPLSFPEDKPPTKGDLCQHFSGGPGICSPFKECPTLYESIINGETSYQDSTCGERKDLVCCNVVPAVSPTNALDITRPKTIEIVNCGSEFIDFGDKHFPSLYRGNETADEFRAQGFEITPLRMDRDRLMEFEISNSTFREVIEIFEFALGPGGQDARRVLAVYMAVLGDGSGYWFCDGTLINDRWILTAAHCFNDFDYKTIVVRLGEYNLSSDAISRTEYPIDFSIEELRIFPDYNAPSARHDLALIKINKPIPQLRIDIRPVCLPWGSEANRKHIGDVVILTGWGATIFDGPNSPILQEVNVTVFHPLKCDKSYSTLFDYKDKFPLGITENNFICAGDEEGGKDACQGDSGGPIVYLSKENRYTLAGIVSTGFGCGLKEYPGIYVPINNPIYLAWIKRIAFKN